MTYSSCIESIRLHEGAAKPSAGPWGRLNCSESTGGGGWPLIPWTWTAATSAFVVERAYNRHLFGGASLQDILDKPPAAAGGSPRRTPQVGRIERPDLSLARVVAASSAFPPFLSPVNAEGAAGQRAFLGTTDPRAGRLGMRRRGGSMV
jgi:hypothetical protein